MEDRETQPSDGPDYHADYPAELERNRAQFACRDCGGQTQVAGSCRFCPFCGDTTGCS